MTFKKAIGAIHLWLGLSSGLVVFILGITGAIFCFEKELRDFFYSERIFVNQKSNQPLGLDSLNKIVSNKAGGKTIIERIEIQPGSNRTYIYRTHNDNNANTFYINQYTGIVQYVQNDRWEFFGIILGLHYDLLLGDTGKLIVSWSTAIFVVMLITGIILWWPKNKAAAKQRFWFRWKKTTKWKRKNYDLHNIPGFYALFITLFISLTGLVFGFKWARNSLQFIANVGKEISAPKPVISDTTQTGSAPNFQEMYEVFIKQETEVKKILFVLPDDKEGTISVRSYYSADNFLKQNTLFFDQYSGKLLATRQYQKLNNGDKASMAVYDTHIGKILGLPGQILAFIGSLVAASLPVTGFCIWWGRRKKYKQTVKEDTKETLKNYFAMKQHNRQSTDN